MRYYAIAAPQFSVTSGGTRVMYGLYGALLAKGMVAFLNEFPRDNDFVAIYPEIVEGNPFNAPHVVRYILNKPGVMSAIYDGKAKVGPKEFDKSENIYYFSKLFGKAQDPYHYMFLPILSTRIFFDKNLFRTKTAYFVGKGDDQKKHPQDAILIDRQLAEDQTALNDLLNECKMLYCYDPVTAMTEVARLAGCPITMFNDKYTKEEYKDYEPGLDGITWGNEVRKDFSLLDKKEFRLRYLDMKRVFDYKLDQFIVETQK